MTRQLEFVGGAFGSAVPIICFVLWAVGISVAGAPASRSDPRHARRAAQRIRRINANREVCASGAESASSRPCGVQSSLPRLRSQRGRTRFRQAYPLSRSPRELATSETAAPTDRGQARRRTLNDPAPTATPAAHAAPTSQSQHRSPPTPQGASEPARSPQGLQWRRSPSPSRHTVRTAPSRSETPASTAAPR